MPSRPTQAIINEVSPGISSDAGVLPTQRASLCASSFVVQPLAKTAKTHRLADSRLDSVSATPLKRHKRGKSMSRRRGQTGSISINGKWWTVRFWMDKPGLEQRIYMREKICPKSGPGLLTASARERKAKEIIAASGADEEETLKEAVASVLGTTFGQQSETWLSIMRKRKAAPSTLYNWKNCLDTWILPTNINGALFRDLPLASIKKTVAQELIDQMVAGGLSPKSNQNYFQVVKMVISSCVNEDGEEIYPRNWKKMGLVIPKVTRKKQRRPCFTVEVMNHLANSLTIKPQMRMLFILCGASGLRVGEALGIRSRRFSITAQAS